MRHHGSVLADRSPELVLSGAYLTGITLASDRLRLAGYERTQESLREALGGSDLAWDYAPVSAGEGGVSFTVRGHANEHVLPLSLVRCHGSALRTRAAQVLAAVTAGSEPTQWIVQSCVVDIFDFGVAVVSMRLLLPDLAPDAFEPMQTAVERVSGRLPSALAPLIADVQTSLEEAVASVVDPDLLRPPFFGEASDGVVVSPAGRHHLLWLHRIYVLPGPDACLESWVDRACTMLPHFHERLGFDDFAFCPGIDSSLIVRSAGRETSIDWILKVVDLRFAYFAAALEMDRSIFGLLNEYVVTTRDAPLSALRGRNDTIVAAYEGLRLFRSQVDTTVTNLGSASVALWHALAQVDRSEQLERSLDQKLDALQSIHRIRSEQASARRAERLNQIVLIFTVAAVISSVAAAVDFAYGERLLGPNAVRTVLLTIIGALCVGLVVTATRERDH